MHRGWIIGATFVLMAAPAAAQTADLSGQLRPRFEIRDPWTPGGTLEFTSMRTRVALDVALEESVTAFFQLQDVRVFGEETSTLDGSANGLDLHQGWVELGQPDGGEGDWAVRIGRQEAAYGGERLIGVVDWAQQARSFDGARIRYRPSADVVVDGLAYRIGESEAPGPGGTDEMLYGVYSTFQTMGGLDVFALLSDRTTLAGTSRSVYTGGIRLVSEPGPVAWRVEGAYQGGRSEAAVDRDISAFMLGARVGTEVMDGLTTTLWVDYLSGDDDTGDDVIRVFDTLFATNHKFYGYMDFFTNIPAHTGGRGLQDIAVKATYEIADGRTLAADLHYFGLAASDGLSSGHLGEELDVTYSWSHAPGVGITLGASWFLAGDGAGFAATPGDNQLWGYAMLNVTF